MSRPSLLRLIKKNQNKKKSKLDANGLIATIPGQNTPSKKSKIELPMEAQVPKIEYPKVEDYAKLMQPNPLIKNNLSGTSTMDAPLNHLMGPDDLDSKSSESSFITDSSPSGSDDEDDKSKVKKKNAMGSDIYHKQQDLANFQAGGHGSMMNSFIIK